MVRGVFVPQAEDDGDPLNMQMVIRVDLAEEDKDEARELSAGKMFRTIDLKVG